MKGGWVCSSPHRWQTAELWQVRKGCTCPQVTWFMMTKSYFVSVRGSKQPDPLKTRIICSHSSYVFQTLPCCPRSIDFGALLSFTVLWQQASYICPIWMRIQKLVLHWSIPVPTCHIDHLFSCIRFSLPDVFALSRVTVNQHICFLPCNVQIEP